MSVQDTTTSFSTEYNLIKDERKNSDGDLSTQAPSFEQTRMTLHTQIENQAAKP